MKVLVIGGGGREHALAWRAAQSPLVAEVLVAPGNAGTARESRVRNADVAADDLDGLLELALREAVDLTIVGPEGPLVAGVVDLFEARGLKCFGPARRGRATRRLEGIHEGVLATPSYSDRGLRELQRSFSRARVRAYACGADRDQGGRPRGGQRRRHRASVAEAEHALTSMLRDRLFGAAGTTVVIEDFLTGEEASFIALVDGTDVVPLASSQDHKTRDDGDRGPNTGGMGAYSPAPVVTAAVHERVMDKIMRPTVRGL